MTGCAASAGRVTAGSPSQLTRRGAAGRVWSGFGPKPLPHEANPQFCRSFRVRMRGLEPVLSSFARIRTTPQVSAETAGCAGVFPWNPHRRPAQLRTVSHPYAPRFGPDLVRDHLLDQFSRLSRSHPCKRPVSGCFLRSQRGWEVWTSHPLLGYLSKTEGTLPEWGTKPS